MSRKHETSFYQSVGKDEVSGSNPDSSSTKTALFAWKGRLYFWGRKNHQLYWWASPVCFSKKQWKWQESFK